MPDSIVLELQRDASNDDIAISSLLRKSLVVSKKMGLKDIERWIGNELNGYVCLDTEVPGYRILYGSIRAWNPARGWWPVMFHSPPARDDNPSLASKMFELLTEMPCRQGVAEIERLASADRGSDLAMPYPFGIQSDLREWSRSNVEFALLVPATNFVRILDSVRTVVLNWALELERQGILGEGMSFTDKEAQHAQSSSVSHVTNFYGPLHQSQVQLGADSSNQNQTIVDSTLDTTALTELVSSITRSLNDLQLTESSKSEMESELTTLKSQTASPNPKRGIIRECLASIRTILESATGNVAAAPIIAQLSQFGC